MAFRYFACIFAFSSAIGCSDNKGNPPDSSQTAAQMPTALALDSLANLSPCTPVNKNQLVYIRQETAFMVCDGSAWTPIDIQGPKGDTGATGETGAKGDKGDDGADGAQGGTGGLKLVYDANDRFVGWVVTTTAQEGADGQSSYLNVLISNGYVMTLNFTTGYFTKNNLATNICFYASADCTGTCRASTGGYPAQSFYRGHSPSNMPAYHTGAGYTDLGSFTYNSHTANGSSTSFGCTTASATLSSSYATASFDLLSGATFPYAAPLKLKAGG